MNNDLMERLDAISNDAEYLKELFEQDSPEKIQAKFAERGVVLTIEEVKEIIVKVVDAVDTQRNGELNEISLEEVSGGFAITASVIGWGVATLMTVGGIAIGWRRAKGKC